MSEHICPFCGTVPEDYGNYYKSRDLMGMVYDLWCPNCGAISEWYDNYDWPLKSEWKISKISLKYLTDNP